jgi:hypothetical protein
MAQIPYFDKVSRGLNPQHILPRELPVKDFRAFCDLCYTLQNPKAPFELICNKFNVSPATP